jgi:peptidoglycan-associated lipoprotein
MLKDAQSPAPLAWLGLAVVLASCASQPKPRSELASAPAGVSRGPDGGPIGSGAVKNLTPVESSTLADAQGALTQDFIVHAGDRVYFDFDAYVLRDDAKPVLDAQADWLSRHPAVRVRIEGNCDELGTRDYNFALGARRANSVRDYLLAHGVAGDRMQTVSYGKEKPIDASGGDEAAAKNRNAHTALTDGAG